METIYLGAFQSKADITKEFEIDSSELENCEILLAWYGAGCYDGSAFVLYRKDGKLWEVDGGHCSCYGLEGQWEPEETSFEALAKREYPSWNYYDSEATMGEKLKALVEVELNSLKRELQ